MELRRKNSLKTLKNLLKTISSADKKNQNQ